MHRPVKQRYENSCVRNIRIFGGWALIHRFLNERLHGTARAVPLLYAS
jgi:hypothetical protein